MALASPPPFLQGEGELSLPLSTNPPLGWVVCDSFQKGVLDRTLENSTILFSKRSNWSPRVKRWRPAQGILIFWRKECLLTGILNPPLPLGRIVTDNSLRVLPRGHLSSLSCVIRFNSQWRHWQKYSSVCTPLVCPRSPHPKCNVRGI